MNSCHNVELSTKSTKNKNENKMKTGKQNTNMFLNFTKFIEKLIDLLILWYTAPSSDVICRIQSLKVWYKEKGKYTKPIEMKYIKIKTINRECTHESLTYKFNSKNYQMTYLNTFYQMEHQS